MCYIMQYTVMHLNFRFQEFSSSNASRPSLFPIPTGWPHCVLMDSYGTCTQTKWLPSSVTRDTSYWSTAATWVPQMGGVYYIYYGGTYVYCGRACSVHAVWLYCGRAYSLEISKLVCSIKLWGYSLLVLEVVYVFVTAYLTFTQFLSLSYHPHHFLV